MSNKYQIDGTAEPMEIDDDPIMSVRQYNALPRDQAERFLSLWVERQVDKVWAEQQMARLRRQLMVSAMGIR
jgi:hypothetical protein